jgi:hypothetical protein
MSKPVSEWDEAYILSLPKENNEFERKGSKKLDLTLPGVDENDVLNELAKQLSAFANTGGGRIIYGTKNDGSSDGGVSTQMKKGGTKEWLERQVSVLTDYEIIGVNVFEKEPESPDSQIHPGKALYVIDVPDSDRAPHQSRRDLLYYVRLNSQSQPASHRLIEDIRGRQRHPRVYPSDIKIENLTATLSEGRLYELSIVLRIVLANDGPLKATDTFLQIRPVRGHFTQMHDPETVKPVHGTKKGWYQWSLNRPLPPQSDVNFRAAYFLKATAVPHPSFGTLWVDQEGASVDDLVIEWTVFADSAPPRKGMLTMRDLNLVMQLRIQMR